MILLGITTQAHIVDVLFKFSSAGNQFLYKGSALKPVRTPVVIFGSLGVCIYGPASHHGLTSYSPIHLT